VKIDGSLIGVTVRDGLAIPRKRGEILIEKLGFRTKRLNFATVPTEPELIVELEMAVVNASANHVPNRTTSPPNPKPEIGEAPTQKPNLLKIITEPWGAVVKVNGVRFGVTAYHDWVLVPWDKGEIVIEKSGFKTKRLSFATAPAVKELVVKLERDEVITPGGHARHAETLGPKLLKVITHPHEAEVIVNGRMIGVTDKDGLDVPREQGEILIRRVGYKRHWATFTLVPTEPEYVVGLEPELSWYVALWRDLESGQKLIAIANALCLTLFCLFVGIGWVLMALMSVAMGIALSIATFAIIGDVLLKGSHRRSPK
jgi:hypothetical protein